LLANRAVSSSNRLGRPPRPNSFNAANTEQEQGQARRDRQGFLGLNRDVFHADQSDGEGDQSVDIFCMRPDQARMAFGSARRRRDAITHSIRLMLPIMRIAPKRISQPTRRRNAGLTPKSGDIWRVSSLKGADQSGDG